MVELFDNPRNLKLWQKGLTEVELLKGKSGNPGAKSRLVYQMGKRKVEMLETIIEKNLPESFHASYETHGVYNGMRNYFRVENEGTTLWHCDVEFRFSGFMKVLAFFMPGSFKKQTNRFMMEFKYFAESQEL